MRYGLVVGVLFVAVSGTAMASEPWYEKVPTDPAPLSPAYNPIRPAEPSSPVVSPEIAPTTQLHTYPGGAIQGTSGGRAVNLQRGPDGTVSGTIGGQFVTCTTAGDDVTCQ